LIFHVFVKGFFWFKSVLEKHPLGLFWIFLFQEIMSFCQTKPTKIIKNISFSCIWTKILKLFEHLFKEKFKILWHVLRKILYEFYNKFVKFQKILVYV
jgi:DNA integrity scanning protein DisA with diadenylate cyclase activity